MLDPNFYGLPHVIDTRQFSREWLEDIFFPNAKRMGRIRKNGGTNFLKGKIFAIEFYEASTRTRHSFEVAILRCGGQFIQTENARLYSSAAKGESTHDTIRSLCAMGVDGIVMRHYEEGAAAQAVAASGGVPIFNAGDGPGQHPSQAVLDWYTLKNRRGQIDGLKIAMCGDLLNGRTVRSLSYLLGKYRDVEIFYVSPPTAQMKPDILEYLGRHCVRFSQHTDLREVAGRVHAIYQTRTQVERGTKFDRSAGHFDVDMEVMSLMQDDAIVMHPLPRLEEIAREVDNDRRAAYFEQISNGVDTKMALLEASMDCIEKR